MVEVWGLLTWWLQWTTTWLKSGNDCYLKSMLTEQLTPWSKPKILLDPFDPRHLTSSFVPDARAVITTTTSRLCCFSVNKCWFGPVSEMTNAIVFSWRETLTTFDDRKAQTSFQDWYPRKSQCWIIQPLLLTPQTLWFVCCDKSWVSTCVRPCVHTFLAFFSLMGKTKLYGSTPQQPLKKPESYPFYWNLVKGPKIFLFHLPPWTPHLPMLHLGSLQTLQTSIFGFTLLAPTLCWF